MIDQNNTETSARQPNYPNLIRWQPGQSGNPGGRPKGLTRLLKEILSKRELCGSPCPGGRTVEECLIEATLKYAINGSGPHLQEIWARLEGKAGESSLESTMQRVVYEIVANGRDRPIEQPADDDGEPGEPEIIDVTEPNTEHD
jgi:hypothetical protein